MWIFLLWKLKLRTDTFVPEIADPQSVLSRSVLSQAGEETVTSSFIIYLRIIIRWKDIW